MTYPNNLSSANPQADVLREALAGLVDALSANGPDPGSISAAWEKACLLSGRFMEPTLSRRPRPATEAETTSEEEVHRLQTESDVMADALNHIWGALYPINPNSWEYPGQVASHTVLEFTRLREKLRRNGVKP